MVIAFAASAAADSRITSLVTGYDKEAAACRIHADGVAKVLAGAQTLDDAKDDVAVLDQAHADVQAYCDEVNATLELLRADPKATYKSLEKQLDEHDNKIRKLRQSSKKTLDALQPVIQRLIPRINARVGAAATSEKRVPGKFPSGRTVELPSLPGTWKVSGTAATDIVEYTEKPIVATVEVRPFSAATCDQQRKAILAKVEHVDAAEQTDATKQLKLKWNLAYTKAGRVTQVACIDGKTGGWLATIDAPEGAKLPLGTVMARMLAAQIAQP